MRLLSLWTPKNLKKCCSLRIWFLKKKLQIWRSFLLSRFKDYQARSVLYANTHERTWSDQKILKFLAIVSIFNILLVRNQDLERRGETGAHLTEPCRSKVAKTVDNMMKWGESASAACPCGEDLQTIQHLLHNCRLDPTCSDNDLPEAKEAARRWIQRWSEKCDDGDDDDDLISTKAS